MYCPSSPGSSSIDHQNQNHHHHHLHNNSLVGSIQNHHSQLQFGLADGSLSGIEAYSKSNQCLKFKYFTTFLICTTCLALLSASLATHKWLISKPIRILKLNGGQTNITSLMLTAQVDYGQAQAYNQYKTEHHLPAALLSSLNAGLDEQQLQMIATTTSQNNKFQGDIYFGLFQGVKVLNYGFGDRISQISGRLSIFIIIL